MLAWETSDAELLNFGETLNGNPEASPEKHQPGGVGTRRVAKRCCRLNFCPFRTNPIAYAFLEPALRQKHKNAKEWAPHLLVMPARSKAWATRQGTNGNNYDVARDLSRIIYQRPGGQFDLYLLSQK